MVDKAGARRRTDSGDITFVTTVASDHNGVAPAVPVLEGADCPRHVWYQSSLSSFGKRKKILSRKINTQSQCAPKYTHQRRAGCEKMHRRLRRLFEACVFDPKLELDSPDRLDGECPPE